MAVAVQKAPVLLRASRVYEHVYGNVYGPAYRHAYRHGRRHVTAASLRTCIMRQRAPNLRMAQCATYATASPSTIRVTLLWHGRGALALWVVMPGLPLLPQWILPHLHAHMHTHACAHARSTHTHARARTRVRALMHARTHTRLLARRRTHTRTHARTGTRAHWTCCNCSLSRSSISPESIDTCMRACR